MAAGATVLVIDDDPDFLEFVRIVLESRNYRVVTAANAAQGLSRMVELLPDLVLLDVVMSYQFNGISVTQEIRSTPQLRDIPLILVSAIVSDEDPDFFPASEEGLYHDLFMSKPIEPAELLKRVDELISR